ncbi:MAG TPA: aspartate 1-decarboxylase [Candidatus Marinimicrobia bacterium]|nr:aspartate 1-decarboxylase [Candidatus Neomarinimicrobiota bacterium]
MSLIEILKSKIHRATVTQTDLHYAGSITIDRDLMDAAGLYAYEKVQVLNINTGARFETYVIEGKRGEREISLNGAAARLAQQGDIIIIIAYTLIEESEAVAWKPSIITLDPDNNPR